MCIIEKQMAAEIATVCESDERIVFAYLYGSAVISDNYRDIDIAIFMQNCDNPFVLTSDVRYALYKKTRIVEDMFDIQINNDIPAKGDIFALLYLKNIFESGFLIVDKLPLVRADFIERYGTKYRECEGLIAEVMR